MAATNVPLADTLLFFYRGLIFLALAYFRNIILTLVPFLRVSERLYNKDFQIFQRCFLKTSLPLFFTREMGKVVGKLWKHYAQDIEKDFRENYFYVLQCE